MQLKAIITLSLLFLVSSQLFAQQDTLLIVPGSKEVNGSIIQDYTNRWQVTYITADGKEVPNKIWTDYGQIIELDGKKYFHRVQDLYDPKMNLQNTWINMVAHKTLAPVSFSTLSPQGTFAFYQFNDNKITGSTNTASKEGEITEINQELEHAVFDWNLYGMLLVALPLKEGLIAKIPFYSTQAGTLQWLIAHVKSQETLPLPDGSKVATWKIETNQNLIFWISEAAPYVIKLELTLQGNAKLLWEVY